MKLNILFKNINNICILNHSHAELKWDNLSFSYTKRFYKIVVPDLLVQIRLHPRIYYWVTRLLNKIKLNCSNATCDCLLRCELLTILILYCQIFHHIWYWYKASQNEATFIKSNNLTVIQCNLLCLLKWTVWRSNCLYLPNAVSWFDLVFAYPNLFFDTQLSPIIKLNLQSKWFSYLAQSCLKIKQ